MTKKGKKQHSEWFICIFGRRKEFWEITAVTLHFAKEKKKVNTQEQLSGNNAFYKLKKSIAIENTTIVISYQDTKVLKICAKGLYNLDINN